MQANNITDCVNLIINFVIIQQLLDSGVINDITSYWNWQVSDPVSVWLWLWCIGEYWSTHAHMSYKIAST